MAMICDEIVHILRRVLDGITVSDETLAVEVIKQVGHGGNIMAVCSSAMMFRKELFFPVLFRRQSIDQWLADGARPIVAVAHERVQQILAKAGPVPLGPGADEALEQLLRSAVAEAKAVKPAS